MVFLNRCRLCLRLRAWHWTRTASRCNWLLAGHDLTLLPPPLRQLYGHTRPTRGFRLRTRGPCNPVSASPIKKAAGKMILGPPRGIWPMPGRRGRAKGHA